MVTIYMVEGDLKPIIEATLTYKDGSIVNLAGCTVKFHMMQKSTVLIDKPAEILEPKTEGKIRYNWEAGDTNITGKCTAEFEVTFSDSKTMTFPTETTFEIVFRKQIK